MVDAHLHLVHFLQRGPSPHEVISGLDRAGVERAVAFDIAVKKKWTIYQPLEPSYYLDDNAPCIYYSLTEQIVADPVLELPHEQQRRLAPLVCGFDPTDRFAAADLERTWKSIRSGVGWGSSCYATTTWPTSPRVKRPAHCHCRAALDLFGGQRDAVRRGQRLLSSGQGRRAAAELHAQGVVT